MELVRLANQREHAVVLLDGHGPLAFRAAGHWAIEGYEHRLVYESLDATDRVLCWNMMPPSSSHDPVRRSLEDAETREDLVQCFIAPRDLLSIVDKPWTKEWLDAAIGLGLAQPQFEPLTILLSAFQVGSAAYERLLRDCRHPALVAKFRGLEALRKRNPVQYETLTGASRRLLEVVCSSDVIRLRSHPGTFEWLDALRARRLIAFDGGGIRSRELKRAFFLLVSMQVLHAVRRHFAVSQRPLPVVLVLEEAGAMGLVTPFVLGALQELRKAGLAIHLLTQSSLDFGDPAAFERILGNAAWQAWYQVLSPADQEVGAKVLTNAAFDSQKVHFRRPRMLPQNESPRRGAFGGFSVRRRYRHISDAYFKSPQLQEQEYRTKLATLRIGERLVRDRATVSRERVRRLTDPRIPEGFPAFTRAVIARVRQQSFYFSPSSPSGAPTGTPLPNAAERLERERREHV